MQQVTYPTAWSYGKPRGSIKEQPTAYLVVMSPPNEKQTTTYFRFREYKNKEEALVKAKEYMKQQSDRYGLTRNMIRFIDKDTIEVKLTQDQIMKTDSTNLDKVEQYPVNAKKVRSKYYVLCQDKKKTFPFTDLIVNYKTVEYINGDSLDLRSSNLKELGTVKAVFNTKPPDNNKYNNRDNNLDYTNDMVVDKQYDYFKIKINRLPKNIWLLGKPAGTIFNRKNEPNIYSVRVNDEDNKQHTKTFNVVNYKSKDEAYEQAKKWQIETSYKLNMTKNLIKIVDNTTIEVKLTKNKIMKTDKVFIPLIQTLSVYSIKSGNGMVYAGCFHNNVDNKYHRIITDFNVVVDHKNGNTLDNRLTNLRSVDYSMNNSNKHDDRLYNIETINTVIGPGYKGRVRIAGKEFIKYYNPKEYTEEEAKKDISKFKKEVHSFDITANPKLIKDKRLLLIQHNKIKKAMHQTLISTCLKKHYTPIKILGLEEGKEMYDYYFRKQIEYYQQCSKSKDILVKYMQDEFNISL